MSTGRPSAPPTAWNLSPSVWMMLVTWGVIVAGAYTLHTATSQKNSELRSTLLTTQSSISELERRVQAGDTSAIAELAGMRKQVADFDRVLATQQEQFRLLSDRVDEAKSRQAVAKAQVAGLRGEVAKARERLLKLKTLQATWTARQGSLLTGDPGRRIAASPAHLELAAGLWEQSRPTPADLQQWESELDALADPIASAPEGRTEIAVTPEHGQLLSDLSQRLAKAVAAWEQQTLLLEAVLQETAAVTPAATTLEQALQERRTKTNLDFAQQQIAARATARKDAEAASQDELAKLEVELVKAATRREAEKLRAQQAMDDQLAKAELDRLAEETRVKDAQKRAEIAGLKSEVTRVEGSLKAAALEREFERELPAIRGLLSAFLSDGIKYRSDNTRGPASLSYIVSQQALEPTPNGSYVMAFLANSSDRPAGGLNNPASPEALRRAQDYLKKYGALMVEKGLLAP